uniref:DNA-directed DNA polymerase n=1 Tax=viral metagenome TaxID=1070528 RepID=A0A6M3L9T4_9ZZZZ
MKTHKFKQRALSVLTGETMPSAWLFTDTETKVIREGERDKHIFTLGWVIRGQYFQGRDSWKYVKEYFSRAESWLSYINQDALGRDSTILCGHNIFFDIQAAGFFPYFHQRGWKLEYVYDKGLVYILKIVNNQSSLTVLSTTNWFDCSLRDLGDMLDISKGEVEFDNVSRRELKAYCLRDTEIVAAAVAHYLEFITTNDLGRFSFTGSSQALKAYRKRFMTSRIFIHTDDAVHELERSAYIGGRNEAFFIGTPRGRGFVTLDINGMYPYVMKKYRYPSKLLAYMEGEPLQRYLELLGEYMMIAEVTLDTQDPVYATRYRGKTVFPTGRFDTWLCTGGLNYAREHGHIKKIRRAAVYQGVDLFTGYVDYFSALRSLYAERGQGVMVKLCKDMHNKLYGKFGERGMVSELYESKGDEEYWRDEVYDMMSGGTWIETYLMGMYLLQHQEGETPHSAPAIAAHITENARLTLWDLICCIGRDRVIYCDTDSVIVPEDVLKEIKWHLDPLELGALKVQDRYKHLEIGGAKNYRTDDTRHIKGIPAQAKEVAPGVFEYMHFKRQCMCLRERITQGVPAETNVRRLVSKYDKGVVTSSGVVVPLEFPVFAQPDEQLLPF